MAYVKEETSIYSVNVTSENGEIFSMNKAVPAKSSYFKIHEMNGRHNDMELFEVIGEISKSGKDVKVVGIITRLADYNNKIVIPNISRFAENNDMSREALVKLLKRAVDSKLLFKIDTGYYMLNPYIIMSKGLTSAGFEAQELAQIKWREITGLLTQQMIDKIVNLSIHLGLSNILRASEFNLSVAEYYHSKGVITEKQKQAILKKKSSN